MGCREEGGRACSACCRAPLPDQVDEASVRFADTTKRTAAAEELGYQPLPSALCPTGACLAGRAARRRGTGLCSWALHPPSQSACDCVAMHVGRRRDDVQDDGGRRRRAVPHRSGGALPAAGPAPAAAPSAAACMQQPQGCDGDAFYGRRCAAASPQLQACSPAGYAAHDWPACTLQWTRTGGPPCTLLPRWASLSW